MWKFDNPILTAAILIVPALACAQTGPAGNRPNPPADRVTFYEVPLACPAARGLGCGSAAKPVLLTLEKKKTIQEAWLDHAGTTLAIVWEKGAKASTRKSEVQSLADDRGISLHELTGERRNENLKSFEFRSGWYRGAEVDRLSEEEAGIIVDRLIRRAAQKEPSIERKAASLKAALTKIVREQLVGCTTVQCREDCRKQIADIAREHLTEAEFNALVDARRQGYQPVDNEK